MKTNLYLCLCLALLTIAHLAYTVESRSVPLQGNHFSSGILLSSDGKVLEYTTRMRSDEQYIYYLNRVSGVGMDFILHFSSGLFGSARLVSGGIVGTLPREIISALDRDIEFNYTYIAKANSKVSLYRLNLGVGFSCYYVPELSITLCPGSERIRVAN